MSHVESLQVILAEPLSYLHPLRLQVPAGFETPEVRKQLNLMVLEGLELQGPWPSTPLSPMAHQWVGHWRQLPYIASLMGAYLLMPALSRGAGWRRLPLSLRRFAGYSLGPRSRLPIDHQPVTSDCVEAAGLNALWSWHAQVPHVLLQRLVLQFSEAVVSQHRQWPVPEPDTALFFMAVQHARRYPIPV